MSRVLFRICIDLPNHNFSIPESHCLTYFSGINILIISWSLFKLLVAVRVYGINRFGFLLDCISPSKYIYYCIDACGTIFLHLKPGLIFVISIDCFHHSILWNCVHILDQFLNQFSKDLIVITCHKKIIHLYVHNDTFISLCSSVNSWLASCCF